MALFVFINSFTPASAFAQESCQGPFIPVAPPLTDLAQREYVRMESGPTGFSGGLYPNGSNERPPAHEAAGVAIARSIVPLDAAGDPSPDGKIVLISVGMSNTSSEFGAFQSKVHRNPAVNPALLLVNGAQGGRTSDRWVDPAAPTWQELDARLARFKATPAQVQVAWVKQTQTRGGDFPDKALALQSDLEAIVRNLKTHFPNIKIVYLSSRTRSYTYWRGLSPEPVAYETGFAVKWLIEKQIEGDPALNFDPANGETNAPYLAWGPYLWADGENPRSDGLVWTASDMTGDCTHPSPSGNEKVATLLLDFFMQDTTAASWFPASSTAPAKATPTLPVAPATASPTSASTPVPTSTGTSTPTLAPARVAQLDQTATPAPQASPTEATLTPEITPAPSSDETPRTTIIVLLAMVSLGAVAALGWRFLRR